jgi:hypothetical protein
MAVAQLNSDAIARKLQELFAQANETQRRDLETLADALENFIAARFDNLGNEQQEQFAAMQKSGWQAKIKLAMPLIKYLGIDLEVERTFDREDIIKVFRKVLGYQEPTELKLLEP